MTTVLNKYGGLECCRDHVLENPMGLSNSSVGLLDSIIDIPGLKILIIDHLLNELTSKNGGFFGWKWSN
jgi:hypothetical protein